MGRIRTSPSAAHDCTWWYLIHGCLGHRLPALIEYHGTTTYHNQQFGPNKDDWCQESDFLRRDYGDPESTNYKLTTTRTRTSGNLFSTLFQQLMLLLDAFGREWFVGAWPSPKKYAIHSLLRKTSESRVNHGPSVTCRPWNPLDHFLRLGVPACSSQGALEVDRPWECSRIPRSADTQMWVLAVGGHAYCDYHVIPRIYILV